MPKITYSGQLRCTRLHIVQRFRGLTGGHGEHSINHPCWFPRRFSRPVRRNVGLGRGAFHTSSSTGNYRVAIRERNHIIQRSGFGKNELLDLGVFLLLTLSLFYIYTNVFAFETIASLASEPHLPCQSGGWSPYWVSLSSSCRV